MAAGAFDPELVFPVEKDGRDGRLHPFSARFRVEVSELPVQAGVGVVPEGPDEGIVLLNCQN